MPDSWLQEIHTTDGAASSIDLEHYDVCIRMETGLEPLYAWCYQPLDSCCVRSSDHRLLQTVPSHLDIKELRINLNIDSSYFHHKTSVAKVLIGEHIQIQTVSVTSLLYNRHVAVHKNSSRMLKRSTIRYSAPIVRAIPQREHNLRPTRRQ